MKNLDIKVDLGDRSYDEKHYGERNLHAGFNGPPPPPVDIESQRSFLEIPKQPYWKRLIKNTTFQMIFAALLAITIGLIVAATVEKVPDAAKSILALPGYMWLKAVKCVGTYDLPSKVLKGEEGHQIINT